jgi:hypothetical protein
MCCGIVAVIESGPALGEQRVADQVGENQAYGATATLSAPQVANLIVASGTEKQLDKPSPRDYRAPLRFA